MADLEDTIFKENIPGRWSKHTDNKDDNNNNDNDNDNDDYNNDDNDDNDNELIDKETEMLEYARDLSNSEIPETVKQTILAERYCKGKSNTGVKGVLEDYKMAMKLEEAQREANEIFRNNVISRMVNGYVIKSDDLDYQQNIEQQINNNDNDNSDDELLEDDTFLEEFRKKRLQELKATSSSSSLQIFGTVIDADVDTFINEVDNVDQNIIVIVHLYDPDVHTCLRLNKILEEICETMINIKFVRMQTTIDKVALPIINIYKGGEVVTVIAAIAAELGTNYFTKEDIQWLIDSNLANTGL